MDEQGVAQDDGDVPLGEHCRGDRPTRPQRLSTKDHTSARHPRVSESRVNTRSKRTLERERRVLIPICFGLGACKKIITLGSVRGVTSWGGYVGIRWCVGVGCECAAQQKRQRTTRHRPSRTPRLQGTLSQLYNLRVPGNPHPTKRRGEEGVSFPVRLSRLFLSVCRRPQRGIRPPKHFYEHYTSPLRGIRRGKEELQGNARGGKMLMYAVQFSF